jgi:hypothetical protein
MVSLLRLSLIVALFHSFFIDGSGYNAECRRYSVAFRARPTRRQLLDSTCEYSELWDLETTIS